MTLFVVIHELICRRRTNKMDGGGTQEITFHNIGGHAGPAGKTGAPSTAAPIDGSNGPDGEGQIYIEKPDGVTTGPYKSSYNLEAVEFEVVDSNEDGIVEFGEEVTLRNIRVRNSGLFPNAYTISNAPGGMPSPSASEVTIEGVPTDWLIAPRTTHKIPPAILSGATVRLDGRFTYKVRRPKREATEQPFSIQDSFLLRGHMSGIDRILRDFHTPRSVTIEYPIEMTAPKYLRCLAVGQEAKFTWKVRPLYKYRNLTTTDNQQESEGSRSWHSFESSCQVSGNSGRNWLRDRGNIQCLFHRDSCLRLAGRHEQRDRFLGQSPPNGLALHQNPIANISLPQHS